MERSFKENEIRWVEVYQAMKVWLTTDTHLGHRNIEEFCGRPPNFEKIILKNYKKISPNDLLIHLGDIALHHTPEWNHKVISHAQCRRWLLKGNHDSKSYHWYLTHGWDVVANKITTVFNARVITFSHEPLSVFDGINIHGHIHSLKKLSPKHFPVSIEKHYDIINLESLTKNKK